MSRYNTIREAAEAWVQGFNAIPSGVLEKLGTQEVYEITPISRGDRVYIYGGTYNGEYGEVVKVRKDDKALVEMDGDRSHRLIDLDNLEAERDDWLPMWGTLWTFGDSIDEEWANGEYLGPHLQEMADCGFRIYEQEDFGLIFGIDGCGYDFYESHWIPLYKARGLKWHEGAR